MTPNAGVVPPEPVWVVNIVEIYLDGSIGGSRQVPIAGQISFGIDAKVAVSLATALKVWNTGPGRWNFASSVTVSYVWTKVTASLAAQNETASNLFDLYFSPVIAGYHFSKDEHLALSVNVWAPTGKYDSTRLANTSLNTGRSVHKLHTPSSGQIADSSSILLPVCSSIRGTTTPTTRTPLSLRSM